MEVETHRSLGHRLAWEFAARAWDMRSEWECWPSWAIFVYRSPSRARLPPVTHGCCLRYDGESPKPRP